MSDLVAACGQAAHTATNFADLASQAGLDARALRALCIREGLPLEFLELRTVLMARHPLARPERDPLMHLRDAARRERLPSSVKGPVTHLFEQGDEPFAVVFTGDWHIGEAGTDHARLARDVELLASLKAEYGDRLRIVAMGDYIGGYMRSKTPANTHQILDPREQREAACEALRLIRPDLVIEGDHDGWHSRQDDQHEWLAEFCEDEGFAHVQWGATLEFLTGSGWTPRILARHRFDGSRRVNPDLPQINLHGQFGPADVVALAHVHSNPGVRVARPKRHTEAEFFSVQSGTYKVFDEYAKKLGLGSGEYGVPAVLIDPHAGTITPSDLADLADQGW